MATTYELIASQTLGSDTSSVSFTSIPSTFTDLVLQFSARTDRNFQIGGVDINGDSVNISFNGSTSNFSGRFIEGSGSSAYSSTVTRAIPMANADTNTANSFASAECYIPNYAGSTNKSFSATGASEHNGTVAYINATAGLWSDTSAINEIGLSPTNGTVFKAGSSFYLYGITKA